MPIYLYQKKKKRPKNKITTINHGRDAGYIILVFLGLDDLGVVQILKQPLLLFLDWEGSEKEGLPVSEPGGQKILAREWSISSNIIRFTNLLFAGKTLPIFGLNRGSVLHLELLDLAISSLGLISFTTFFLSPCSSGFGITNISFSCSPLISLSLSLDMILLILGLKF